MTRGDLAAPRRRASTLGGLGMSLLTETSRGSASFLLDQGRYDGRQRVPADWVAAATSRQVPTTTGQPGLGAGVRLPVLALPARLPGRRRVRPVLRGAPRAGRVVAITAATTDMQDLLDIMWATVPAALTGDAPLSADDQAAEGLQTRLGLSPIPHRPGPARRRRRWPAGLTRSRRWRATA